MNVCGGLNKKQIKNELCVCYPCNPFSKQLNDFIDAIK